MQPTGAKPDEPTILPFEDRNRMTRLYEEVVTRLEEMAMITARSLKMDTREDFVVSFRPVSPQAFPAVEILQTAAGSGYYDYRSGACFGRVARHDDGEVQK